MLNDDLAALDRRDVAVGDLHEAGPAGGEIGDQVGRPQREPLEVDHVEVGEVAGRHDTAIDPADVASRSLRLVVDDRLEREPLTPSAVPRPVRDRRGRERPVADRVAVRACVGEPEHRMRRRQHLVHVVEVAAGVVHQRDVEQPTPVAVA